MSTPPPPYFIYLRGLRGGCPKTHLFSTVRWSTGLGQLRFEPALQEEALTSFLKSPSRGLEERVGGIGQTRFPVRADRPEVAHFALWCWSGQGGAWGNSDPTLRHCRIWDSAPSLLFPILRRRWQCICVQGLCSSGSYPGTGGSAMWVEHQLIFRCIALWADTRKNWTYLPESRHRTGWAGTPGA